MSPEELAGKLRSLSVSPPTGLDRDRLLFEAGRRAATPSRGWKLATLAACLLAAGIMTLQTLSPMERIVYVPQPASAPMEVAITQPLDSTLEQRIESPWSMFHLRQQVMQQTTYVPTLPPLEGKPPTPLTVGSSISFPPAP